MKQMYFSCIVQVLYMHCTNTVHVDMTTKQSKTKQDKEGEKLRSAFLGINITGVQEKAVGLE